MISRSKNALGKRRKVKIATSTSRLVTVLYILLNLSKNNPNLSSIKKNQPERYQTITISALKPLSPINP